MSSTPYTSGRGQALIRRILTAPWIWAAAATWGFYELIPHLPAGQDLAERYFRSHPLEYVLAALFFTGLSIIGVKTVLLLFERRAFAVVPDFGIEQPTNELHDSTRALASRISWAAEILAHTYWGRRLEHLLTFFKGRNSTEGLHDHLSYLSDADADRLQSSHALLQTVIWSIPILGFLGTVMGITLAIANVTPDQLDSSLNDVTGGLAVAFDTTALALSLSLVLGFASLFIKRSEERLLAEIDERCRLEVHRCFPVATASHPLVQAEEQAAASLIEQTNELIERQTHLWTESLAQVREQWARTIDDQRRHLAGAIQNGAEATLSDHAEQLLQFRQELLTAQEEIGRRVSEQLTDIESRREGAQRDFVERLQELTGQLAQSAMEQSRQQSTDVERILHDFSARVETWQQSTTAWQQQMQQLTAALTQQSETLLRHGEQLTKFSSQEESLIRLQENLNRNLDAIRNTESFDETLHNLSAAVHLLTARARNAA